MLHSVVDENVLEDENPGEDEGQDGDPKQLLFKLSSLLLYDKQFLVRI